MLAYAAHLLWLLNNPIVGKPLKAVSEHQYNLAYLFLYAAIFSLPLVLKKQVSVEDVTSLGLVFINCMGFSVLVFLATLTHLRKDSSMIALCFFGLLMISSISQWIRTNQPLGPAIFACFGFLALSIAIYGFAAIPNCFLMALVAELARRLDSVVVSIQDPGGRELVYLCWNSHPVFCFIAFFA